MESLQGTIPIKAAGITLNINKLYTDSFQLSWNANVKQMQIHSKVILTGIQLN